MLALFHLICNDFHAWMSPLAHASGFVLVLVFFLHHFASIFDPMRSTCVLSIDVMNRYNRSTLWSSKWSLSIHWVKTLVYVDIKLYLLVLMFVLHMTKHIQDTGFYCNVFPSFYFYFFLRLRAHLWNVMPRNQNVMTFRQRREEEVSVHYCIECKLFPLKLNSKIYNSVSPRVF